MSRKSNVSTIPAGQSFVDALSRGILADSRGDPLILARLLIFLPTRRAARTLREAFLRQSDGHPLLLPRMVPLGDVDDDDLLITPGTMFGGRDASLQPAIDPFERNFLLTRLVQSWWQQNDGDGPDTRGPDQAYRLAVELGRFLDQAQTEGLDFDRLADLVPDDFASHWKITLEFLGIVTKHWPLILAEQGAMDPAARRNLVLEALAEQWTESPPERPVIAAGSTGSIPATAALLKTIAHLPNGKVVLPGLDLALDDESWDLVEPTHPQYALKQLLNRLGTHREDVAIWPAADVASGNEWRVRLLNEATRPAQTVAAWRSLPREVTGIGPAGLHRIDAPTLRQEAGAIALIMRETLETPGKTAVLVTPDRQLARYTAAALGRWHIDIDDSAGVPLSSTPVGSFVRLTAEMVLSNFAPVPLLAVLKHPFCAVGGSTSQCRGMARNLERQVLRGPRPGPGTGGISALLESADTEPELIDWWQGFCETCGPLASLMAGPKADLSALLEAHIQLAEKLATTTDTTGADRLWTEADGEAMASFFEQLAVNAPHLQKIEPGRYPAFLDAAMATIAVRPAYGLHPRLAILGPLEARLHHADCMILGSLNDGSWPGDPGIDPWLSRPMKQQLELPQPERRLGLSAHDFVQAASASEVYFTRAKKIAGAPTIPSRWLLRLDAVLGTHKWPASPYLEWAQALDQPEQPLNIDPPAPRPPLDARPRKLSVTQIERWMRDPYALYAQKILGLRPLDPIDADPGAREHGNFIHGVLDQFLSTTKHPLPESAIDQLHAMGARAFEQFQDRPAIRAIWWPRFEKIAEWFIAEQRAREAFAVPVLIEQTGEITIKEGLNQPFVLTAKADRIDHLQDGNYEIIDYKTGEPPSPRQIIAGYAPQMPLEGLILTKNGFPGISEGKVGDLAFWQLRGGGSDSKMHSLLKRTKTPIEELIAEADIGLRQLVAEFDQLATPYLSHPNPLESGYGDYDHLARVKEWGALTRDD